LLAFTGDGEVVKKSRFPKCRRVFGQTRSVFAAGLFVKLGNRIEIEGEVTNELDGAALGLPHSLFLQFLL